MLDPEDRSGNWSIGTAFRWQQSPYLGEDVLPDFLPTLSYSGDTSDGDPRPEGDPLAGLERGNALAAGAQLTRKLPWGRVALELRQDASGVHDGAAM